MVTKTVVIFGATGVVGTSLSEQLSLQQPTWKIHAVSRQAGGSSRLEKLNLTNVSVIPGDPLDKKQVLSLAKDADIIVSCVGLHKYQAKYWAETWPTIVENLLAATIQGGRTRRLVFCDNLYAYGVGHTKVLSTQTPTVEPSLCSKPGVRSQIRITLETHMKQYPGTLSVVGGADFFGPHVTTNSFLGDTMTGKILQEQSPLAVGSATAVHDFCYVPDFGAALAVACTDDRALDRFWICPHTIHDKTLSEIAHDISTIINKNKAAAAAGRQTPPSKVSVLPPFLVYLLSPFMEFMWEMMEMLPFWTKDYKVDDSDFIKTFGVLATPYDQALGELVSFYQTKDDSNNG
eukprot:scaffold38667_cov183-Amphora_coffeaeformis.AAC.2